MRIENQFISKEPNLPYNTAANNVWPKTLFAESIVKILVQRSSIDNKLTVLVITKVNQN
jgi:hypothetical protein